MNKLLSGIVATCIFIFIGTNAWALTIGNQIRMEYDWNVPYQLTDLDPNSNTTYLSFCLESQQYFTPGETYYVQSVGEYATGGGGGAISGLGDPISENTRWLYAAYRSNVFSNLQNAAQLVQEAIWWNEDEEAGILASWTTLNNTQYSWFNASGWDIVAVNFSSEIDGSVDNQSQLIGVAPVPEPATMLLLGTGLIGLAGFGRKKFLK